jgi:hypothetical protein
MGKILLVNKLAAAQRCANQTRAAPCDKLAWNNPRRIQTRSPRTQRVRAISAIYKYFSRPYNAQRDRRGAFVALSAGVATDGARSGPISTAVFAAGRAGRRAKVRRRESERGTHKTHSRIVFSLAYRNSLSRLLRVLIHADDHTHTFIVCALPWSSVKSCVTYKCSRKVPRNPHRSHSNSHLIIVFSSMFFCTCRKIL